MPEVTGSNPVPPTIDFTGLSPSRREAGFPVFHHPGMEIRRFHHQIRHLRLAIDLGCGDLGMPQHLRQDEGMVSADSPHSIESEPCSDGKQNLRSAPLGPKCRVKGASGCAAGWSASCRTMSPSKGALPPPSSGQRLWNSRLPRVKVTSAEQVEMEAVAVGPGPGPAQRGLGRDLGARRVAESRCTRPGRVHV